MSDSIAIFSRRCWHNGTLQPALVQVKNGVISEVITGESAGERECIHVGDDVLMPGVIDVHVHINEPGRTQWEGFDSASRAAAAGGITTVIDMPLNSSPVTTSVEALEKKLSAATGKLHVNCGFWGGVIPGNQGSVADLVRAGVFGMKAFLIHSGIDEFPASVPSDLEEVMVILKDSGRPILVHCELEISPADTNALRMNPRSYKAYLRSRPLRWEVEAIKMMIDLCRRTGCRTHVVHLSAAAALPFIRKAKEEDLPLTVETCPHYLFFNGDNVKNGNTLLKCAPPVRGGDNGKKLIEAISSGSIDFLASDHSPCPPELKDLEYGRFQNAWGGISGLQFLLSVSWTTLRDQVGLETFIQLLTKRPAAFAGLATKKGMIANGYDADLTVWSPDEKFSVDNQMILHRHKVTPYIGSMLFGKVKLTVVNGKIVWKDDRILGLGAGKVLISN